MNKRFSLNSLANIGTMWYDKCVLFSLVVIVTGLYETRMRTEISVAGIVWYERIRVN